MKSFLELVAIGVGLGVFFALGQWTWETIARRFLGWRKPAESSQTLTISVDNRQAMEALDELQRKVTAVSATIASMDPNAVVKRELQ